MADVKISGLPASTTPLDGTEVLPIVQGTTTKQVSIANVTAGRAVAAASVALTGVVTQSAGLSTPYTLASIGIPFVIVSSGSMGNNGALSGITAVKATYVNAYVYLPADAISAGSAAGWYYAVFSSTTAATVYDNVYTSGVPTIPGSPTAFVTTGPGAYTQTTGSYLSPMVITLPANSISANGFFTANVLVSTNNTGANSKLLRLFVDNSFASGAWAGGGSEWGGIFTFQKGLSYLLPNLCLC